MALIFNKASLEEITYVNGFLDANYTILHKEDVYKEHKNKNVSDIMLNSTEIQTIVALFLLLRESKHYFFNIPVLPGTAIKSLNHEPLFIGLLNIFDRCSIYINERGIETIALGSLASKAETDFKMLYEKGLIIRILNILSQNPSVHHSLFFKITASPLVYRLENSRKKNFFNIDDNPIIDYCNYLHKCRLKQFDLLFAGWELNKLSSNEYSNMLLERLTNIYQNVYLLCFLSKDEKILTERIIINE